MIQARTELYSMAIAVCLAVLPALSYPCFAQGASYDLPIFPAEHKHMVDSETGAQLTFLTTNAATDTNLYFHERSWLADESVILFNSNRDQGGLMGYLTATGELIRFTTPQGGLSSATAAVNDVGLYAVRNGNEVVELRLALSISNDPAQTPSKVTAVERVICTLPSRAGTSLNENCDGTKLAVGLTGDSGPEIIAIDITTGAIQEVCRIPDPPGYGGHVQWSRSNPNLLSFAGRPQRLMVVDIRGGQPRNVYKTVGDEHVTHECWWIDDQLLFVGGVHPEPNEDSHVKVVDVTTGIVRIIGAGAWWPQGTDEAIARVNWWHPSGSVDGYWVAADNWHGDIMLFEGKTTRPRLLTQGHRTYGHGEHPHVGWDRTADAVVFTSHKLGSPDVCIATIPTSWRKSGD
jgi:hypothetical protein